MRLFLWRPQRGETSFPILEVNDYFEIHPPWPHNLLKVRQVSFGVETHTAWHDKGFYTSFGLDLGIVSIQAGFAYDSEGIDPPNPTPPRPMPQTVEPAIIPKKENP